MTIEKFDVRNRWTNAVQFTAEIECAPDASVWIKLGLAARWAKKTGSNLDDADLRGSNLSGADLSGADLGDADLGGADLRDAYLGGSNLRGSNLDDAYLRGAYLRDVDLSGADLGDADLRSFKADLWMTLTYAQTEVPALIKALRNGKVSGSQYEGDCACLVGTLANARGESYRTAFPDASPRNPAEQWFLMIREGDKPGDDSAGGFAAGEALEWVLEYCALAGIDATV